MPIVSLIIMIFLREAIVEGTSLFSNQEITVPIPFYYNLPLKALTSLGSYFNVTDCNEWYLYSFNNETASDEDREYFGTNNGLPMTRPRSSGMMQGGSNLLEYPCGSIGRSVPYFKEHYNKEGKTMN